MKQAAHFKPHKIDEPVDGSDLVGRWIPVNVITEREGDFVLLVRLEVGDGLIFAYGVSHVVNCDHLPVATHCRCRAVDR